MRLVLGFALVFVAGCKQLLGIDEGAIVEDAAVVDMGTDMPIDMPVLSGHDEDADGVDDAIDNCPATSNSDQARVEPSLGSACDPRPRMPGDRIALFLPFVPVGQPPTLDIEGGVQFTMDSATLEDSALATRDVFSASQITAEIQFTSFLAADAVVAVAIGTHACSVERCSADSICLVAREGITSVQTMFAPTGLVGTLALVQTDSLSCVLSGPTGPPIVANLANASAVSDHVTVFSTSARVAVNHLAVYVIGN